MTRHRRDDRIVDLTEEFLTTLPPARSYTDIWYDREQPYLFARRDPYNSGIIRMGMVSGRRIIRGAALQGVTVKRIALLPVMPLAEARAKAKALREQYEQYAKLGVAKRGNSVINKNIPAQGNPFKIDQMLNSTIQSVENPNYDSVMSVLMDAYQQLTTEKGAERHASGLHFEDQDMMQIMEGVGINFALGQAMKKILEGRRMKITKARNEFLGAIIYLAGAAVWLDRHSKDK